MRALHLVLYAIAGRGDPELRGAVLRFAPGAVMGPTLLLVAGFFDGPLELGLWVAALSVDYLSALVGRGRGWRLSPAHFVERHGLIIIIALGESIVALGVGAAGLPLDAPTIIAAMLGMVVAATLWWSYFDWVVYIAQARITEARRRRAREPRARRVHRTCICRWSSGIVLFALGMKQTLGHVDEPLGTIPPSACAAAWPSTWPRTSPSAADRVAGGAMVGRPPLALLVA